MYWNFVAIDGVIKNQLGKVLCFLWGTNWIFICYVEESRPPLWSSGQSSWILIQTPGLDSRRYQIFWEVVGLKRGPLSLVSTTEELLGWSSGYGLENREYGRRDPSRWQSAVSLVVYFAHVLGSRSIFFCNEEAVRFLWRINRVFIYYLEDRLTANNNKNTLTLVCET
jgi:hypothetical protein